MILNAGAPFARHPRACPDSGLFGFLLKPLRPEALRAALARWTGHGWTRERTRVKVAS